MCLNSCCVHNVTSRCNWVEQKSHFIFSVIFRTSVQHSNATHDPYKKLAYIKTVINVWCWVSKWCDIEVLIWTSGIGRKTGKILMNGNHLWSFNSLLELFQKDFVILFSVAGLRQSIAHTSPRRGKFSHSVDYFVINYCSFLKIQLHKPVLWELREAFRLDWSESHLSRDMTKRTKWVCAQRRLRSAWASAQSDQSLCCPHEERLDP